MNLNDFVIESNRIEGINRVPLPEEIWAHERFLVLDSIGLVDLEAFVNVVQPGATLRRRLGMNVRVGDHIAPPGGPDIEERLNDLLNTATRDEADPYKTHLGYERLHPFMDGNGRSGRALWLWMMGGNAPLGFLHQFYYQTLQASR